MRHGNGRFLSNLLNFIFFQICILKPLSERTPILVYKNKSCFWNKRHFLNPTQTSYILIFEKDVWKCRCLDRIKAYVFNSNLIMLLIRRNFNLCSNLTIGNHTTVPHISWNRGIEKRPPSTSPRTAQCSDWLTRSRPGRDLWSQLADWLKLPITHQAYG